MVFQEPSLHGVHDVPGMSVVMRIVHHCLSAGQALQGHVQFVTKAYKSSEAMACCGQGGPAGSVMVFQDPSLPGQRPIQAAAHPRGHPGVQGGMSQAGMADFAMELLMGGEGPGRGSSMRTSSWSDDGLQAAGGSTGATLAGEHLSSCTLFYGGVADR